MLLPKRGSRSARHTQEPTRSGAAGHCGRYHRHAGTGAASAEQLAVASSAAQRLERAAALLGRVLVQDVERRSGGAALKQGVSKDRVLSTTDPEMRYGRKSPAWRFDGSKAQVALDTDSQLAATAVRSRLRRPNPSSSILRSGCCKPPERSAHASLPGVPCPAADGRAPFGPAGAARHPSGPSSRLGQGAVPAVHGRGRCQP